MRQPITSLVLAASSQCLWGQSGRVLDVFRIATSQTHPPHQTDITRVLGYLQVCDEKFIIIKGDPTG